MQKRSTRTSVVKGLAGRFRDLASNLREGEPLSQRNPEPISIVQWILSAEVRPLFNLQCSDGAPREELPDDNRERKSRPGM
jgi:hypothetical protein